MKRLSILLVGLLSAVLIFSVVGFGTDYDSANVTVSFQDALVLEVTGTLDFSGITQSELETSLEESNDGYLYPDSQDVTVSVTALTDYNVGVTFEDESENASSGLFEISNAGGISSYTDIPHFKHSLSAGNVDEDDKPYGDDDTVLDITGGDLPGTINWPDADVDNDLIIKMDPSELNTDALDAENNTYRLDFWVYSGSITTAPSSV